MSRAFSFKLAVSQVYHVSILRFEIGIQAGNLVLNNVGAYCQVGHVWSQPALSEVQSKLKITLLYCSSRLARRRVNLLRRKVKPNNSFMTSRLLHLSRAIDGLHGI